MFQLQRPLTRYLPIRNEHLDLRAHIETAGHQLEIAFPNVIIDTLTCRGYLSKLSSGAAVSTGGKRSGGSNGNHSTSNGSHGKFGVGGLGIGHSRAWNKRWFVFDRSKKTLVYYADKSEAKAKGGVYFRVRYSLMSLLDTHRLNA